MGIDLFFEDTISLTCSFWNKPFMATQINPTALILCLSLLPLPTLACTSQLGQPPEMVPVAPGSFTMGTPTTDPERQGDEPPPQEITLTTPFALARCETTVAEFRLFVEATGHRTDAETGQGCYAHDENLTNWQQRPNRHWRDPGFPQTDTHPVVCVSWNDAMAYAAWLGQQTGEEYRLPSEAEWEYAARAGTTSSRFWGDDPDAGCAFANGGDQALKQAFPHWNFETVSCDDGAIHTAPVGSYQPNPWGLADMVGNAAEWTRDCVPEDRRALDENGLVIDTTDPEDCTNHPVRGGAWWDYPAGLRSAYRFAYPADGATQYLGFRLARDQ